MDGPDAHGIVVLMVHVNMDKYTACSSDAARSAVLRQDLAAGARGDFAVVADFLVALQQDDEAFLTELIERPTKGNRKAREDQQPQQQDDQQDDEQPQQDTREGAAGKGGDGQQQQQQLLQKQQTGRKPAARRLQYDFSQAPEFQQIFAFADAQADAAGAPEGSAFLQALLLGSAGTRQQAMLQLLHRFVQEHDHLPKKLEAYAGQPLGQWCSNRRSQWKKGAMDAELARQLEAVPKWEWGQQQQQRQQPKANLTDEQWLQLLREFQQQHFALPTKRQKHNGYQVGSWVTTARDRKQRGTLSKQLQQDLEKLPGWVWRQVLRRSFDEKLQLLMQFVQEHHRLPRLHEQYPDSAGSMCKLGEWCSHWRIGNIVGAHVQPNLHPSRSKR
jgi:hypothetical protein